MTKLTHKSYVFKTVSIFTVLLLLTSGNTVSAELIDSSFDSRFTTVSISQDTSFIYPDQGLVSDDIPTDTDTVAPSEICRVNTEINPSQWADEPNDIATDGTSMYIVGYDRIGVTSQWRIEKRDFKSGALVQGFGPNRNGVINIDPSGVDDIAYAIAIDRNAMYVVGTDGSPWPGKDWQWRIEKRSLVDGSPIFGFGKNGVVLSNPSIGIDEPHAIAIDKEYMYVGGFDGNPGVNNLQWRIEKRRLDNGNLVLDFGPNKDGIVLSNPSRYWDVITGIKIDQWGIYTVGYEQFSPGEIVQGRDAQWRVEKRNIRDGFLAPGFGDNQDGVVISDPSNGDEAPNDLAIDENFMYVVGFDRVPGSDGEWRIEKRKLVDGKLDAGFGIGGVAKSNPGNRDDVANAIAIDGEFMYVAGWDIPGGQDLYMEWRIEKRKLSDGTFDANFYGKGVLRFNPSKFNDRANDIVLSGSCFRAVGSDDLPGEQNPQLGSDLEWRIIGGMR